MTQPNDLVDAVARAQHDRYCKCGLVGIRCVTFTAFKVEVERTLDAIANYLTPVCETCEGSGVINKDYWSQDADDCPDCQSPPTIALILSGERKWEAVRITGEFDSSFAHTYDGDCLYSDRSQSWCEACPPSTDEIHTLTPISTKEEG